MCSRNFAPRLLELDVLGPPGTWRTIGTVFDIAHAAFFPDRETSKLSRPASDVEASEALRELAALTRG